MGTWATVVADAGKEDQVTSTQDQTSGAVTVTLVQTWVCVTDQTWRATPVDALSAPGLPTVGGDLEVGGQTFTVSQCRPLRTGPYSFDVQVTGVWTYTPPKDGTSKWNVTVTFSGSQSEQDAYQDKDGNAIVNSANQPYDPTVKETLNDEKIVVSYNTTLEQSSSFVGIRGKVNSGSVTLSLPGISRTWGARQLYCDDAEQSGSINLQDGTVTYQVTINLTARADGYIDNILDQGFYEIDDDTNELIQIKDKWGDLISAPVLLDGFGHQLDPDADPYFNTYKIEKEADFTSAFEGLGG